MFEQLRASIFLFTLLVNIIIGESNVSVTGTKDSEDLKSIVRQLVTDYYKLSHDSSVLGNPSVNPGHTQASDQSDTLVQQTSAVPYYPSQVPNDQTVQSGAVQNITDYIKGSENNGLPVNGAFTQWTVWSSCPDGCGRTALRSRERYCTNPAPANNGQNCEGPRFQLKLCKIKRCRVDGGLTTWTAWSPCSTKCGIGKKKRHRDCTNPPPGFGGASCPGPRKQIKSCYGRLCSGDSQDQDSIVDIDPKVVCGFDPCHVTRCVISPHASCVSDFKCQPVFFDAGKERLDQCKGDQLYLSVDPQTVCRFNPCKFSTCQSSLTAKCEVNTHCHPIFIDEFGQKVDCKENDEDDKEGEQVEGYKGELESDAERLRQLMKLKQTDDEDNDVDEDEEDDGDEDEEKRRLSPRLKETSQMKLKRNSTRFHKSERHKTNILKRWILP